MPKSKNNLDFYNDFSNALNYDHGLIYDESIDYRALFCNDLQRADNRGRRYIAVMTHKPKTYDELYVVFNTVVSFGKGMTKACMLYVHGVELGEEKWKAYCDIQSLTNTFDFKSKKYGMTKDEFDIFNKSRAVTLGHMIERHGSINGVTKWKEYCNRQAYTNTKTHLGDRYEIVCAQKSHTMDSYIAKYGDYEIAKQKLDNFYRTRDHYSKISQTLFFALLKTDVFENEKTYFAENGGEYGLYDPNQNRYYKYDFVCPNLQIAIEFQGDHYHGNPKIYLPDDYLKGRGQTKIMAKSAWKADEFKAEAIQRERGFNLIAVWETDFKNDDNATIERIRAYAKNRI